MPERPRIRIPEHCVQEILQQVRQEYPLECCGLLAGVRQAGVYEITKRLPLTNHLGRENEFESDPAEMLAAHRFMRQSGLELLAVYHSHPSSEPIPSRKDRERSISEEVACLIVGPDNDIRCWWLINANSHENADFEPFNASSAE